MIKRNLFVLFSILMALFLASCDVGLGSAVDTEPPVLTIDYPQSGSIIRDSFILAGSCKDDVAVSKVEVVVKTQGSTSKVVGIYEADVDNKDNFWQVELNHFVESRESYNGWEYADGEYSIDVRAYDDASRVSGTSSISVKIDNTAPLLILKTPGNANIDAPTEYGTTVKIAGTIVDDNTVQYLSMGILDKDTEMDTYDFEKKENLIDTWTLTNVNTAGGTEEVFAKLSGTEEEDLRYKTVYKDEYLDSKGNVSYNLLFTVTDEAKEYKNPKETENATLGNSTDKFFFSDDVTSVWSSESKGTTFKTVQKVINGTNTDVDDELKAEILNIYNNEAKQYAACLINKDANPKYSVLGYSVDENNLSVENKKNIPSAQPGGTISIQSVMGRNANYILPKTIHVIQVGPLQEDANLKATIDYLYGYMVENFVKDHGIDKDADGVTSIRPSNTNINYKGYDNIWRELGVDASEKEESTKKNNSSSCENYTYSVKVAADTEPGKIYLIAAFGDDEQNGKLTNDGYYIFKGSSSDIPPTVLWESDLDGDKNGVKDRGYVKDYSKLKFGGKYNSNVDLIEGECKYSVVVTGENGTDNPINADFEGPVTIDKTNKLWRIDLGENDYKFIFDEEKEYLYDITVTLKNSAGTGTNNHKIHVDTKKPVVNISSISPTTIKKYLNGGSEVERTAVNGKIKFQGNVDDTALMKVEYEVSYAADGDVLFRKSLGKTYTVNEEINTRSKFKDDGTEADDGKEIKDEHTFIIKLIATDEAGNVGEYDSSEFNKNDPLFIDQSTDAPILVPNNFTQITDKTKVKENDNVFDASGNKTLLATITDDDLLQTVQVEFYKEDKTTKVGNTVEIKNLSQSSYALKQVLPATDGIYWVQITAKDNDGHNKDDCPHIGGFFIAVDTDKPEITETSVSEEKTRYVKKDGSLSFKGTVSDKWEVSSLSVNVENSKDSSKNKSNKITINEDGSWNYTFNAATFNNDVASYKLVFEVTDRSGKINQIIRNIKIDINAPSVDSFDINANTSYEKTIYSEKQFVRKNNSGVVIGYDVKLATSEDKAEYWYNQSQLPIKVVASDNESEISSVEWCTNYDVTNKTGSWSSLVKGETEWTGTVTCNQQGENTIYVKVVDAAGNETISSKGVMVDTEAPEGISEKLINNGNADTVYVQTNGSVKISVTAEDEGEKRSGIGMVSYSYENTIHEATLKQDGWWEVEIPWTTISQFVKARQTIKLDIYDKVGNLTKENVVNIQKDTTAPTTTIKPLIDADDSTEGLQVNGIITISGAAKDNTVLKSVTLQYQKKNETAWKDYETLTTDNAGTSESDIANWSFNVDTTKFGDGKYKFRGIVTDAAGNSGSKTNDENPIENEITVFINQDSDRPIIHLTNLEIAAEDSTATLYLHNSTLSGYVSDDDGVKEFYYSFDGTSYTKVTLKVGNAWEINVKNEGANTVYFKIVDTVEKNNPFVSKTPNKPKITDGKNTYSTNDCTLKFNLVLKDPEVTDATFSVYNEETNKWSEFTDSLRKVGGIYTKFKMKINAQSANEIDSDKITVTLNNGTPVKFTCAASAKADFKPTAKNEWESGEILVGTAETPTIQTLNYDVYDKAGKHTTKSMNVSVDNTNPVVTISKPSLLIGSEETIRGGLNETAELYWAVSRRNDSSGSKYADTVIEPNSNTASKKDGSNNILATKWTQFQEEDIGTNWFLYFDGGDETDHTNKFADYLTEDFLGITTKDAIKANTYKDETELVVWIKAIDECGNTKIVNQTVKVDPQGERPAVALSYPSNVLKENSTTEYEPPKLSGTIPLSGIATDNNGAKYAWVQIASSNAGFTAADLKKLNNANYTLGQISTNTQKTKAQINALSENADVSDYGIMVPINGQAWNLSINVNKEFNPTSGTANLYLTIYATDQDTVNGAAVIHKSSPVTQQIIIDAQSPYVERTSLVMVQYYKSGSSGEVCTDGTVSSGTVAKSQAYSAGMSISGIWFLQGKFVDDDSGLKSIIYNKKTVVNGAGNEVTSATDGSYFKKVARTAGGKTVYDYNFQIPLGNKTAGTVGTSTASYRIVENTSTALADENTFSVIYDNKAPVIKTNKNDSVFVKFDDKVENSNGFYSFGSVASEEDAVEGNNTIAQSGVTRVAFYFTRDLDYNLYAKSPTTYNKHSASATNTRDLFDVMIYNSGNETKDVASGNTIIGYDSSLTLSEGIYWKEISGNVNGNTFTYTADNPNVHEKGLIKINGVIYLIDKKAGNVLTLKGNSSDANLGTGTVTAYIGLCNVIDNGGEKNTGKISSDTTQAYGYGYYPARASDDGDLITETFTKQGTDWIFDAAVNSKNLPDGPITVHVIAFDGAGNYSEYSYAGTVSNNAPRIAGMMIGTDENGDGEVAADEFIKTYSGKYTLGYDSSDNIVTQVTFPTQNEALGTPKSLLTVKGKTVMKPELVGGNGDLSYTYAVYNHSSGLTWNETSERTVSTPVVIASGTNDQVATLSKNIELNVSDFIGTNNGQDTNLINDGNNKKFSFKFGDSTPGLTKDAGISNNASIDVIMNVSLRESESAKTWIKPFYWNDKNSNSLFQESTNNGHIEISSDITGTDKQPKVSGAVKLEGIAQDNALLSGITVSFNKEFGNVAANESMIIGTYIFDSATWTTTPLSSNQNDDDVTVYSIPATGWASEITQATYGDLLDAGITLTEDDEAAMTAGTKNRTSIVPYNSQDYGHIVHWTMYIDSSKIKGVAARDVKVTAKATDRGSPKWDSTKKAPVYTANAAVVTNASVTQSGGDTGTGTLSGTYTMDIVPYITKVYTAMSALQKKESKWSTTSRTSNGHYPVRVVTKDFDGKTSGTTVGGETIKIYGFNLGNDTVKANYTPNGGSAISLAGGSDIYGQYVSIGADSLKATATKASGAFALTVSGVSTLNNSNNNNAKGSVTEALSSANYNSYAYNRQPNGDNNNLLTDDVYFDVWEFNSAAAIPISGKIEQPVMKIRPTDGKIGFAFVNGPLYFSMGGSESVEDYSYQYWTASYDFFTSVGFTYDDYGNSFAVGAGGDINESSSDRFILMSSKWGIGSHTQTGSYDGINSLRLEQIAQKTNSVNYFDKQRIKSPSIISSTSNGGTNLYLAYYDAINDEIRFKSGHTGGETATSHVRKIIGVDGDNNRGGWMELTVGDDSLSNETNKWNDYVFYLCDENGNVENGAIQYAINGYYCSGDYIAFTAESDNTQFPGVAKKISNNIIKCNGTNVKELSGDVYVKIFETRRSFGTFLDTATKSAPQEYNIDNVTLLAGGTTGKGAGSYLSLGIIPANVTGSTDTVVAVWYDQSTDTNNSVLRYAYNTNPIENPTNWTYVDSIFSQTSDMAKAGEYCKVTVDSFGGVHIAAYDPVNLDLCYAYLPASNKGIPSGSSSFKTCIVDGNGVVGSNLTIDVAKNGARIVPYIGYYSTSSIRPKMAFYVGETLVDSEELILGFTTNISDGTIDDEFTGSWECSIVPTVNTVEMQSNLHNDINIGVWKTSDGEITAPNVSGRQSSTRNKVNGYSSSSYGQVYGNGTSNPVLGYAIKHGSSGDNIETAQMK